jgi:hypothetical protein
MPAPDAASFMSNLELCVDSRAEEASGRSRTTAVPSSG